MYTTTPYEVPSLMNCKAYAKVFFEKYRSEDVVSGDTLVGDARDRTAIPNDDMIRGGAPLEHAVRPGLARCRPRPRTAPLRQTPPRP